MARTDISYGRNATEQNQFQRLGHPGRYYSVIKYTAGQTDFTGSNYGYGAVIMKTHGGAAIELSGGGSIDAVDLPNDVIELSVSKISGGTSAEIYVLKRQQ